VVSDYIADNLPKPRLTKCCSQVPDWATGYITVPSCGDGPYFVSCSKCLRFYKSWSRSRAYTGWNKMMARVRAI